MTAGFIKIMSISICIAREMDNKVLEILLSDFAKEKTTNKQLLLIYLLCYSYGKNGKVADTPIYKLIKSHMTANETQICKKLLYA